MERTLVLIKPDGVVRHLVGRIITRFEDAGLKIVGMKMVWAEKVRAEQHYKEEIAEKHGEEVRSRLIDYLTSGPVIAFVLEGVDAVSVVRKMVGSTYPNQALPGTIRGDFAHVSKEFANKNKINVKNLIHASESVEEAQREIDIWFNPDELHTYKTSHEMICFDE